MKRTLLLLALGLSLGACSTTRMSDAETLALYKAHAGEPVKSFQYLGHLSGWTPLGDTALAVWTKPTQAYLLELYGPCNDLEFAPAISLSSIANSVSARFDNVYVHGGGAPNIRLPCRIENIRLLDVKGLKQAQKNLREAQLVEREATAGG
jgi:hypothetical protein